MEPSTPVLPTQVTPPELALSDAAPHAIVGVEVVAVPVLPGDDDTGPALGPGAEELSEQLGADLLALLEAEKATGKVGEVVRFPVPLGGPTNADLRWVFLVGVGDQGTDALRRAGAALARATVGRSSVATSIASLTDDAGLEAFVVGAVLGSFSFSWRSQERPESAPVARIVLTGCAEDRRPALERGLALGGAGWRARLLATVPSNLKTPPWLAEQARLVAEEAGLAYRVWDEQQLAAEGFGGIIGVGQGSATPPRLVRLDYTPRKANRRTPTVVLVGKGITFDSGGLSIKPAGSMHEMKSDMAGAAAVVQATLAIARLDLPVKVSTFVPMAENMLSGSATRPGDVLRMYGGTTVEIFNTDAEGRLVLGDALVRATEVEPDLIVDVATLTGHMVVALGDQVAGVMGSEEVVAQVLAASETAGEACWPMPIPEEMKQRITSSKVADLAQHDWVRWGGGLFAGAFLREFTAGRPWAHVDIAGPSFASGGPTGHVTSGGTGFAVATLVDLARSLAD